MNYHYYRTRFDVTPLCPEILARSAELRETLRPSASSPAGTPQDVLATSAAIQRRTWERLERAFNAAVPPGAMPGVRPPLPQLAREGLSQSQLHGLSVQDANRLARSLAPDAHTSYLHLQLASETFRRQLMHFYNVMHDFLLALEHADEKGAYPEAAAQQCVPAAIAFYEFYALCDVPTPCQANGQLIVTQMERARVLCEAFAAHRDAYPGVDSTQEPEHQLDGGQEAVVQALSALSAPYEEFVQSLVAFPENVAEWTCTHAPL
jgi:hypothetical protein